MTRKRIAIVSALALVTAVPSFAIFGVGDIVIDLTQAAHAIQQIGLFEKQIGQLEKVLDKSQQAIDFAKQNAHALPNKGTYQRLLNTALQMATTDAVDYVGAKIASKTGNPAPRTVTLSDSASDITVALLNQISQGRIANRPFVNRWTSAVSSGDPNANTAAALAGLTNTGLVNLYTQQEQALALNSSIAQSLMIQNMRARNEEVAALNADAEQRRAYQAFRMGDIGKSLMNLGSR